MSKRAHLRRRCFRPDIIAIESAGGFRSRDNAAPVATLPMSALNSSITTPSSKFFAVRVFSRSRSAGDIEKILQDQMAVFGCDAFGMKTGTPWIGNSRCANPITRLSSVCAVTIRSTWHARAIDDKRVITCCLERSVDAAKDTRAFVTDIGQLAMDGHRRRARLCRRKPVRSPDDRDKRP